MDYATLHLDLDLDDNIANTVQSVDVQHNMESEQNTELLHMVQILKLELKELNEQVQKKEEDNKEFVERKKHLIQMLEQELEQNKEFMEWKDQLAHKLKQKISRIEMLKQSREFIEQQVQKVHTQCDESVDLITQMKLTFEQISERIFQERFQQELKQEFQKQLNEESTEWAVLINQRFKQIFEDDMQKI